MLSWKIKFPYWFFSILLKDALGLGKPLATGTPPAVQLKADTAWKTLAFISDMHLHADDPATFALWRDAVHRCSADALFILGDLFEIWVGDDQLQINTPETAFEQECAAILRQSVLQRPTFIMVGNRDFLLGQAFCDATGCRLLSDPCALHFAGLRYLLSHGDAWCLDDTGYQRMRKVLRSEEMYRCFFTLSLNERVCIAKYVRQKSQHKQRTKIQQLQNTAQKKQSEQPEQPAFIDLHLDTVCAQLVQNQAKTLIHGHTHRPEVQSLGQGLQRIVLSDWDASAQAARAQVLYLDTNGHFTHTAVA